MLAPQDLRNGTVFVLEGKTYTVINYEHNKRGRGHATIRVKIKEIVNGTIIEKTFTDGDKFEEANVARRNAQYLYDSADMSVFMDNDDFAQLEFQTAELEWEKNFLVEGMVVTVLFVDDKPVNIQLPKTVELDVIEAEIGIKGDTATGATKKAILQTGYQINVPLFIEKGDRVIVNTDDGDYQKKA